jgi:hypothetical protein
MTATKAMCLRLAENQAAELAAVARTDEVKSRRRFGKRSTVTSPARRSDPDFQKRLRRRLEDEHAILERLAGEAAS